MSENDTQYTKIGVATGQYYHRSGGYVYVVPHDGSGIDLPAQMEVPEVERWDRDQIPETAYYNRLTEASHDDGMVGLRVAFTVYEHDESGDRVIGELWQAEDGQNELMEMILRMQDRIDELENQVAELESDG